MQQTEEAYLVIDTKSMLGEGPHWDDSTKRLYFVDIIGQIVYDFDMQSGTHEVHRFSHMVSSVIPAADGGWVLTMQDGIYRYDPVGRSLAVLAQVEADLPGNRFNDAKCDPAGRLWAGTMDMSFQDYSGSLYRVDADGGVERVLSGVGCSNGLAWDETRSQMYYIDTMKREVCGFRYEPTTGDVSGQRKVLELPLASAHTWLPRCEQRLSRRWISPSRSRVMITSCNPSFLRT